MENWTSINPDGRVGLVGYKTPDISFYPTAAAPASAPGWSYFLHATRPLAHQEGTYTFAPAGAHPMLLRTYDSSSVYVPPPLYLQ
jgi:hypothetical protein